ncbi:MAG: hypothetical protein ACFFDN_05930 [Candidatus Hodarchaeota archaeon]
MSKNPKIQSYKMRNKIIRNRNKNFKDSTVPVNVMKKNWDFLIILDACRYDYFERIYRQNENLFNGKLFKYKSIASSTMEWRNKSFKGYYNDIVYISTNPYINSTVSVENFLGKDHFFKVYDIWNEGWDQKENTVLPDTVTNSVINLIKKHPDKRFIIHYVQPHAPYINLDLKNKEVYTFRFRSDIMKALNKTSNDYNGKKSLRLKIIDKFLLHFNKLKKSINRADWILGNQPKWKLREYFRLEPLSPMDAVRRIYGDEGLKKAYMNNLKLVLKSVLKLLKHLTGKIVITGDHGELLGENGCYSHLNGSNNPYLKFIPWLEIKKSSGQMKFLKEDLLINTLKLSDFSLKI